MGNGSSRFARKCRKPTARAKRGPRRSKALPPPSRWFWTTSATTRWRTRRVEPSKPPFWCNETPRPAAPSARSWLSARTRGGQTFPLDKSCHRCGGAGAPTCGNWQTSVAEDLPLPVRARAEGGLSLAGTRGTEPTASRRWFSMGQWGTQQASPPLTWCNSASRSIATPATAILSPASRPRLISMKPSCSPPTCTAARMRCRPLTT